MQAISGNLLTNSDQGVILPLLLGDMRFGCQFDSRVSVLALISSNGLSQVPLDIPGLCNEAVTPAIQSQDGTFFGTPLRVSLSRYPRLV